METSLFYYVRWYFNKHSPPSPCQIQDASLGGSSDDEDFLGVLRGPSTFANAFLYVGLGTVALGLVIAFVGTGEKGFKTVELRLIGPSLIGNAISLHFIVSLLSLVLIYNLFLFSIQYWAWFAAFYASSSASAHPTASHPARRRARKTATRSMRITRRPCCATRANESR